MLIDNISITGHVRIDLFDSTGVIKDSREIKNLVVTTGKTFIASRMVSTVPAMGYMELGTGTTSPVVGNTTLQTAVSGSRVNLASSSSSTNVATYTATFSAGVGTGAITEAGIFDAATAGNMLCRTVFATVTKNAADAMSVTWTLTVN